MKRTVKMTASRRTAYARQARKRLARHEQMLKVATKSALDEYLTRLRRRLDAHTLTAAAAPAPDQFTSAQAAAMLKALDDKGAWEPILDAKIMPTYRHVLDEILGPAMRQSDLAVNLTAWRNQWLDDRRQELVNVPDQVTSQLRTELQDLADKNGTNVDDAANAVGDMLDTGYPSWEGRAELIARTETVGANNQGSLAAWSELAGSVGATDTATKTWLATEDAHTRDTHAEIDGTSVGLSETFTVGDYEMTGPGDPNAGPEEVCNCRCVLTYEFPDGQEAPADMADPDLTAAAPPGTEPANAPNGETPTGACVLLMLSDVDAGRLAIEGGEDPSSMHVTLGYLASPADTYDDSVRAALLTALQPLASKLPLSADAFATAHFNPEDEEREPCAVVLVQSDALASAHDDVADAVGSNASTTFPVWIPHVTIAYNADPSAIPDGVVGGEVTFDRIVVGWGAEQTTVDPTVDYEAASLTAAPEAPVTVPTDTTTPPPAEATGGDTAAPGQTTEPEGITWSGPLGLLDTPSSDNRIVGSTGGRVRPLPLPLSWQESSEPGHDGSVIVGRILSCEIRDGMIWGSGDWLDPMVNFNSQQAMAQVDAGLGLISLDLAVTEYGFATSDGTPIDPILFDGDGDDICEVALEWEVGGATIVSFPAFETARITLDDAEPGEDVGTSILEVPMPGTPSTFAGGSPQPPTVSADGSSITLGDGTSIAVGDPVAYPGPDGSTVTGTLSGIDSANDQVTITPPPDEDGTQPPDMTVDVTALEATTETAPSKGDGEGGMADMVASLLASSEVRPYNAAYFAREEPDGPLPLTVNPETGEVYGHLATYGQCHIGKLSESGTCVEVPTSPTDYSYFHLSPIVTDQGPLDVGRITVGTGHAMPGGGFANAVHHYDNTGTAVAVVRASDGKYGPWVAGQVIHDTPPARVEELMRSPLSGDWRRLGGHFELVAALAVNTPGFPVRRPRTKLGVVGKSNTQMSLVAAAVVMRVNGVDSETFTLPSGATIARTDMESMVAAAMEALSRNRTIEPRTEVASTALRLARARLALTSV